MVIALRHPEISDYPDGYPLAVDEAQAVLLEGRGWVRVDDATVDYSRMTKGALLDEVERLGLDLPEKSTVANLRALLEADQAERLALLNETEGAGTSPDPSQED
jgi:hypothetical protein